MSAEVWAVIKFKPKEGCDDEFRECLEGMRQIIRKNYPKSLSRIIKIESGEYVHLIQYDTIDSIVDSQIDGLTWLDSVSHLLDKYENNSRTEAFSGPTI